MVKKLYDVSKNNNEEHIIKLNYAYSIINFWNNEGNYETFTREQKSWAFRKTRKKIDSWLFNIETIEVDIFSKRLLRSEVDNNYIFDKNTTLAILAGFQFNRRVMIQGYHGTGKSSYWANRLD